VALGPGGTVLRLAGLYHSTRGAHSHFLDKGSVPSWGGGLVNQLHYDDAASLVLAALARGDKGKIFVGCDNAPLTRQEIADAAGKALGGSCEFTGSETDGPAGRMMNNDWTRSQLDWEPAYPSFTACMEEVGKAIPQWR